MYRASAPKAVAWAFAALCTCMAGARAQTEPLSDDPLPAVRITGTALRRIDAETALPVIVLRRADIDRSGARTTTELLQQLPVMQGMVQTNAVVGNDSRGYASVSIHDLGDAYTLVLLNGQRLAPFGGQLSNGALASVDLNAIPLAMVERIEVLTDGASALYGADALGGVVNIITRRERGAGEANEATAGVTWPRGGAREWRASAFKNVGQLDTSGQTLSLGVSAMNRSALRATARAYARDAQKVFEVNGRRYQYTDAQFNTAPANLFDSNFYGSPYQASTGSCAGQSYDYSYYGYPFCIYNFAADLDLVPAQQQRSAMASYTLQLSPDSRWQLDALWSRSEVVSHLAPVPADLSVPAGSPVYGAYLSGLGVADDPTYATYRFVDAGRRGFNDSSTLAHLATQLTGRQQGWAWMAGLSYSVSDQASDINGTMGKQAAQGLIDNQAFNPFALPGQQSSAALSALQGQLYDGRWLQGRSTLSELQWQASRNLMPMAGGALKLALGANWRHERLSFRPSLFAQGLLSDPVAGTLAASGAGDMRLGDAVAMQPASASRHAWGGFAEVLAPVSRAWEWGAAARFDHDDLAGNGLSGKASTRWRPSPTLLWRASLGTGFRSPTLNQLRFPGSANGVSGSWPCTEALRDQAIALGAAPCTLGNADTYPLLLGGNAGLQAEHSVQANLGFRLEPLPGHTVGMDLWAVHIHDRIGTVDESVAFEAPGAVPEAWATVPGSGGPQLAFVGRPTNLGTLLSSGLDLEAGVRQGTPLGLVDSQLRATIMLREDSQLYPGGPWFSPLGDGRYGGAALRYRAQWRTSVSRAGWTHSLTARYQSGYVDSPASVQPLDDNGQPVGDPESIRLQASWQMLWDWQTTWQVNGALQLSAGVLNVFDAKPPLSVNATGPYKGQMVGYDERYYDARGRMLTLEARLAF